MIQYYINYQPKQFILFSDRNKDKTLFQEHKQKKTKKRTLTIDWVKFQLGQTLFNLPLQNNKRSLIDIAFNNNFGINNIPLINVQFRFLTCAFHQSFNSDTFIRQPLFKI